MKILERLAARDRQGGASGRHSVMLTSLVCMSVALIFLAGCSSFRAVNVPLERWDPNAGYRASRIAAERSLGDVAVILAVSGGGTRAADLPYGVLQELRDTPIEIDGRRQRLLDEVDAITSVSSGSFTAA